jgi:hypothetical protein
MWHRVMYLSIISAALSGFIGVATAVAPTWIR